MFGRRQQVHQPVVVKVVVQVVRVLRRHVALGELGHHRHFPHEIGREIGAVRSPFRQFLADVRIREPDDERNSEEKQRTRAGVGARESRQSQRAGQRLAGSAATPPRIGASISRARLRAPTAQRASSPRLLNRSPTQALPGERPSAIRAAARRGAWRRARPAARTRPARQPARPPSKAERARKASPGPPRRTRRPLRRIVWSGPMPRSAAK